MSEDQHSNESADPGADSGHQKIPGAEKTLSPVLHAVTLIRRPARLPLTFGSHDERPRRPAELLQRGLRLEGQNEARDQQDSLHDHEHLLARVRSSSLIEARSKHAEQSES